MFKELVEFNKKDQISYQKRTINQLRAEVRDLKKEVARRGRAIENLGKLIRKRGYDE